MTSYRELFDEIAKRHKRGDGCPCADCYQFRYRLGHELEQKVMRQECPERSNFVKEQTPPSQQRIFAAFDPGRHVDSLADFAMQWYLREKPMVMPDWIEPAKPKEPEEEESIEDWLTEWKLDRLYGPNRKREDEA